MFENKYTVTKEMLKEYVNKVICRNIYIYGTLVIILTVIECILKISNGITPIMLLNTGVFFMCLFIIIIAPKIALSNLMDFDKKLHNGERPEAVVTFGDKIVLKEGEQTITIDYSQIYSYIRMKNLSVLMFTRQNGIMFVEENFVKGNKEDFEKYILSKCPKVRNIIER